MKVNAKELSNYVTRKEIVYSNNNRINILSVIQDNGTIKSTFEVDIHGYDCWYTDSLCKAVEHYNKFA